MVGYPLLRALIHTSINKTAGAESILKAGLSNPCVGRDGMYAIGRHIWAQFNPAATIL